MTEILLNAALSKFGLEALGYDSSTIEDGLFKKPMGNLAGVLGDRVVDGQPVDDVLGKGVDDKPNLMLLIGSRIMNVRGERSRRNPDKRDFGVFCATAVLEARS